MGSSAVAADWTNEGAKLSTEEVLCRQFDEKFSKFGDFTFLRATFGGTRKLTSFRNASSGFSVISPSQNDSSLKFWLVA